MWPKVTELVGAELGLQPGPAAVRPRVLAKAVPWASHSPQRGEGHGDGWQVGSGPLGPRHNLMRRAGKTESCRCPVPSGGLACA